MSATTGPARTKVVANLAKFEYILGEDAAKLVERSWSRWLQHFPPKSKRHNVDQT